MAKRPPKEPPHDPPGETPTLEYLVGLVREIRAKVEGLLDDERP